MKSSSGEQYFILFFRTSTDVCAVHADEAEHSSDEPQTHAGHQQPSHTLNIRYQEAQQVRHSIPASYRPSGSQRLTCDGPQHIIVSAVGDGGRVRHTVPPQVWPIPGRLDHPAAAFAPYEEDSPVVHGQRTADEEPAEGGEHESKHLDQTFPHRSVSWAHAQSHSNMADSSAEESS